MEAHTYGMEMHSLAKDPTNAVQRMLRGDPSRKNSPVLNQLAKPIPLAQSFDIAATALDDVRVDVATVLIYFAKPLPYAQLSDNEVTGSGRQY